MKKCEKCRNEFNTLYRVKYLSKHYSKKDWVFICKACLLIVKPRNDNYSYEEHGKVKFSSNFHNQLIIK